jgi:hypothetical protein
MVGFIGALSSSLCILILVFITLLLGYIDAMIPAPSLFKLTESTYRFPLKDYFINDEFKEEISQVLKDVYNITEENPGIIKIGCSYGFDMDEQSANNIMVYNSIKITSFDLPVDVTMYPTPQENKNQMNYCYIDFEKGDKNG